MSSFVVHVSFVLETTNVFSGFTSALALWKPLVRVGEVDALISKANLRSPFTMMRSSSAP